MDAMKLSRKELHQLVWTEPLTQISARIGVSCQDIKSICTKFTIPLPEPGHWQRIKMGKDVDVPDLTFNETYDSDFMVTIISQRSIKAIRLEELKEDIENNFKRHLKVSKKLNNPDQLVLYAQRLLNKRRVSHYGRDRGFISTKREEIEIYVTPKNVNRALCFMDAFIKLGKARGYSIRIESYALCLIIGEEKLEIGLREKAKRIETLKGSSDFSYEPTGKLVLSVGRFHRKLEFMDGTKPIEKRLSEIYAHIELSQELWAEEMRYYHDLNEKNEELRKIEEAAKEKADKENRQFAELISLANKWQQAQVLRGFLEAVESSTKKKDTVASLFFDWLEWAKVRIEMYDPIAESAKLDFCRLLF